MIDPSIIIEPVDWKHKIIFPASRKTFISCRRKLFGHETIYCILYTMNVHRVSEASRYRWSMTGDTKMMRGFSYSLDCPPAFYQPYGSIGLCVVRVRDIYIYYSLAVALIQKTPLKLHAVSMNFTLLPWTCRCFILYVNPSNNMCFYNYIGWSMRRDSCCLLATLVVGIYWPPKPLPAVKKDSTKQEEIDVLIRNTLIWKSIFYRGGKRWNRFQGAAYTAFFAKHAYTYCLLRYLYQKYCCRSISYQRGFYHFYANTIY